MATIPRKYPLPWGKACHPENPFCDPDSAEYRDLASQFTLQYPTDSPSVYRDPRDPWRTKNRVLWQARMAWERDRERQLRSQRARGVARPCEMCGVGKRRRFQDRKPFEEHILLGKLCQICRNSLRRLNVTIPGISETRSTLDQYQAWRWSELGKPHRSVSYNGFPHEGFLRYLLKYRTRYAGPYDIRQQFLRRREARRAERLAR